MKHDKKILIIRLIAIFLCLTFITSKYISKTFAKYTSSDFGSDSARVATFFVGATNNTSSIDFSLTDINTTTVKEITFNVVNFVDEKKTEVAYNYEFEVSTLNNLPLIITLTAPTESGYAEVDGLLATNGKMDCNGKTTHTYTITIKWDPSKVDYEYTELIDVLTIDFTCNQID